MIKEFFMLVAAFLLAGLFIFVSFIIASTIYFWLEDAYNEISYRIYMRRKSRTEK